MSLRLVLCVAGVAVALSSAPAASQQVTLLDGQPLSIELGSEQATVTPIRFAAPAGTRQLTVRTTGSSPGGDIDVFARSGSPFPGQLDINGLLDASHYWAISSSSSETLVISDSGRFPPGGENWYFLLLNSGSQTSTATLEVTASSAQIGGVQFQINYLDSGSLFSNECQPDRWTAPARQAMEAAMNQISNSLRGAVPVRINACWVSSDGEGNRLAAAGPLFAGLSSPGYLGPSGIRERNTLYPMATVIQSAGTPRCGLVGGNCGSADIGIIFESTSDWSFQTSEQPTPGQFDFISVAMHEISHGLGFLPLSINLPRDTEPGATPDVSYRILPDAYSRLLRFVVDPFQPFTGAVPLWDLDEDARTAALISGSRLAFGFQYIDQNSVLQVPRAYAPTIIEPGSSVSHFNISSALGNQLMAPAIPVNTRRRALGLATDVLNRAGWSTTALPRPEFEDPYAGQWFDPARPGHGIDLVPAPDGRYILTFYTYDSQGYPEWYLATGSIVDGQFIGEPNDAGNTLVRYVYDTDSYPSLLASPDNSSNYRGTVSISFDEAEGSEACRDGRERENTDGLAAFQWRIRGEQGIWCMQPLLPSDVRSTPDLTGHWFAGFNDSGWGISMTNGLLPDDFLFGVIYYGDAQGQPRWSYFVTEDLSNEAPVSVNRRRAYCRTCPSQGDSPWTDSAVGVARVRLQQASTTPTGNRIEIDIEVPSGSPDAATFSRAPVSIQLLSAPLGD